MKEILIFAGTTEGRKLSDILVAAGILHTICVATDYGEIVLKEHPLVKVHQGRMNQEEIRAFIKEGDYQVVVDATHPYADIVTRNIKEAISEMDITYFHLIRESSYDVDERGVYFFNTNEECAEELKKTHGNILLTTGSKELSKYCISEDIKSRLYVRVLPSVESLSLCNEQGICGKQILALQGPFTKELNEAIISQFDIRCLVTKESGITGGYLEKLEATRTTGCNVFVIGHSQEEKGVSFQDLCIELEKLYDLNLNVYYQMDIILAGIGMGSYNGMTKEVHDAIESADILLGAKRMLEGVKRNVEKYAYYMPSQIIPFLNDLQANNNLLDKKKVVILFSGDTGFNSGCKTLYQELIEEQKNGKLNVSVRILPGISSVAYLAACVGESYEDAYICSIHGKQVRNLRQRIKVNSKTYLLMSGVKDVNQLGHILLDEGLSNCVVIAGYQLSYPEQRIIKMIPEECCAIEQEGLYVCLIINPNPVYASITHGMVDSDFIREKVPMTKEEIREVSICKLKLHEKAIVYDIGSGTGSIAVEIARLSDNIQIYSIEQKREAVSLILKNIAKFSLDNISVIEAIAPEGLEELPKPTHVFIGGSGSKLKEILNVLYQKNPQLRVVINAISLETICEMKEIKSEFPVVNYEIVQLQVSRTKQAGNYHLMQAENPVLICSFNFTELS